MSGLFKDDVGGSVYKKGLVAQAKPGFAKVRFDDLDGIVTAWLPTTHPNTQDDKQVETLNVGAQVSCLMDARMEDGCILGAHYSNVDTPPVAESTKWHKRFSDGTSIQYDKAAHVLTLRIGGATFTFTSGGLDVQGGGVTTTGDQLAAGISQTGHTHGGVRSGGDSTATPQ